MDEKRKPGWVFWTVVTLIVFMMYVASAGPVAWFLVNTDLPDAARFLVLLAYAPLLGFNDTPRFVLTYPWLQPYVSWWATVPHKVRT